MTSVVRAGAALGFTVCPQADGFRQRGVCGNGQRIPALVKGQAVAGPPVSGERAVRVRDCSGILCPIPFQFDGNGAFCILGGKARKNILALHGFNQRSVKRFGFCRISRVCQTGQDVLLRLRGSETAFEDLPDQDLCRGIPGIFLCGINSSVFSLESKSQRIADQTQMLGIRNQILYVFVIFRIVHLYAELDAIGGIPAAVRIFHHFVHEGPDFSEGIGGRRVGERIDVAGGNQRSFCLMRGLQGDAVFRKRRIFCLSGFLFQRHVLRFRCGFTGNCFGFLWRKGVLRTLQELHGIDAPVCCPHFQMQVRAGRIARCAGFADLRAFFHRVSGGNGNLAQMRIQGCVPVRVGKHDHIAVALVAVHGDAVPYLCVDDRPAFCGKDRGSFFYSDIQCLVFVRRIPLGYGPAAGQRPCVGSVQL